MEDTSVNTTFHDEIFQWPIARLNDIQVWDKMFQNFVTDPTDKINLLLASPQFFGPLLEQQKCAILFGEVAYILHSKNYLNLSKTEFLQYRFLSKSCKISLDKSIQMSNPCFMNLNGIDHDKNIPGHACWTHLSTSYDISIFKKIKCYAALIRNGTFASGKSSPLITGAVTFEEEYTEDDDRTLSLRNDFKLILTTFGNQIYHFKFNLWSFELWSDYGGFPLSPTKYELLCQFLEMMPNLRSLVLEDYGDRRTKKELDYECSLSDFKLPDLDHLEVVKIKNVTAWAVDTILRKYGTNLRKLAVGINSWVMDQLWYDGLISAANQLSDLSLPPITSDVNITEFLSVNIPCPFSLTSISISVELKSGDSQTFQDLTTALLQIFDSSDLLHTLNISIQTEIDWDVGIENARHSTFFTSDDRLEIPSVRRLWIYGDLVCVNCIDFILGIRDSLEELVLNLNKCYPKEKGQVGLIEFVDYWNRMEESNVWRMMPKLQKITIRWCNDFEEQKFPKECCEYTRPAEVAMST